MHFFIYLTIVPFSFIFTNAVFSFHFVQSLPFFTLHNCSAYCRNLKSCLRGNKNIPVRFSRGILPGKEGFLNTKQYKFSFFPHSCNGRDEHVPAYLLQPFRQVGWKTPRIPDHSVLSLSAILNSNPIILHLSVSQAKYLLPFLQLSSLI